MALPIGEFGRLLAAKRGNRGVRAAAAEAECVRQLFRVLKTAICQTSKPSPSFVNGYSAILGNF